MYLRKRFGSQSKQVPNTTCYYNTTLDIITRIEVWLRTLQLITATEDAAGQTNGTQRATWPTMAAATGRQEQQMIWWRDRNEIGGDRGFVLPSPVATGIDEFGFRNGEYSFDDKDNEVPITNHVREPAPAPAPAPRSATECRSWLKFCGSVKEDDGSRLTMVSTHETILKRPRASGCFTVLDLRRPFSIRSISRNININVLLGLHRSIVPFRFI